MSDERIAEEMIEVLKIEVSDENAYEYEEYLDLDEDDGDGVLAFMDENGGDAQIVLPGFLSVIKNKNAIEDLGPNVGNDHIEVNPIQLPTLTDDGDSSSLFHCLTCDINFRSVSEHVDAFHLGEQVILESDCDEAEAAPENILNKAIPAKKLPKQQLIRIQRIQCTVCPKLFKTTKALAAHENRHHNKEVPTDLVCKICQTVFMSVKSFKLHARMHAGVLKQKTMNDIKAELGAPQTSRTFCCPFCDKTYDLSLKEIHMKTHSAVINRFVCTVCNKGFAKAEHLQMHSITHVAPAAAAAADVKPDEFAVVLPVSTTTSTSGKTKQQYACKYCQKTFGRPHEKVKHERIHTGEKPYTCEVCNKSFRVSYCLTLHLRTHTDERPFVCQICNKRYKSNSVYTHHLLTHSDVRAYQCPTCPKAFKTAVQLSGHKNSHTKPFVCTECGRTFATLYAVRNHMESHKKPNHNLKHTCLVCGATYARGFALKDHMNEQHPDKVESIDQQCAGNIDSDMNSETEVAEQSILQCDDDVEIYTSEIEQFETEEVITDWLR